MVPLKIVFCTNVHRASDNTFLISLPASLPDPLLICSLQYYLIKCKSDNVPFFLNPSRGPLGPNAQSFTWYMRPGTTWPLSIFSGHIFCHSFPRSPLFRYLSRPCFLLPQGLYKCYFLCLTHSSFHLALAAIYHSH